LYFVARGVFAGNRGTAGGEAVSGEPNLYLRRGDATTFVATLSPADDKLRGPGVLEVGDWRAGLGERTAAPTPDGRHLVLESVRPLTGYDNKVSEEAEEVLPATEGALPEVFVYDADSGQIACASCDPSGAALDETLSGPAPANLLKYGARLP